MINTIHLSPRTINQESSALITSLNLHPQVSSLLYDICGITQPPPFIQYLIESIDLISELNITINPNHDLKVCRNILLTKAKNTASAVNIQKLATKYPIFFALKKFSHAASYDTPFKVTCLFSNLYISIFELRNLDELQIDASIYYHDAYSIRDVFLKYIDDFTFNKKNLCSTVNFINSLIYQLPEILNKCSRSERLKLNKLTLLLQLLNKNKIPGQRLREKYTRTTVTSENFEKEIHKPNQSNSPDGSGTEVLYPEEGSQTLKSLTRTTPPSGSKLNVQDDRIAFHSRLNEQAARNTPSISDLHRLPLPCISKFLSFLTSKDLKVFSYFWLLITTGAQPSRLSELQIDYNPRPKKHHGYHIDISSNQLSFEIFKRKEEKQRKVCYIKISKGIIDLIHMAENQHPFSDISSQIDKLTRQFSLHHPGASPTPDRIAASSIIHLSQSYFSDIEAAYLSGTIPARLRAQAHYYPVDLRELSAKYKQAHTAFADKIINLASSQEPLRKVLYKLSISTEPEPTGQIGSTDSIPIISLQALLNQINITATGFKNEFSSTFSSQRILQIFINIIQLQHLQLFILEQLALCSRKFGSKTSYAFSHTINCGWGSEKASAIFSVERKFIPMINQLKQRLNICSKDMVVLEKIAKKYHYNFITSFDIRSAPLPANLFFNIKTRSIEVTKITSSDFSKKLNALGILGAPQPSSPRVNIFKHMMAASLLNEVPQVLLDEFMTHDRDGLDFCAPWSTSSSTSMKLLRNKVDMIISQLNLSIITIGDLI